MDHHADAIDMSACGQIVDHMGKNGLPVQQMILLWTGKA